MLASAGTEIFYTTGMVFAMCTDQYTPAFDVRMLSASAIAFPGLHAKTAECNQTPHNVTKGIYLVSCSLSLFAVTLCRV